MIVPNVHRAAAASAIIAMTADVVIQKRRGARVDARRVCRTGSYAWWSTYPQVSYFGALARAFPGNSPAVAAAKTLVNQIAFCPVNIAMSIAWHHALQLKTPADAWASVTRNVPIGMIEGAAFWVPVNAFGFCVVDQRWQFWFFKAASFGYKFLFIPRTS